MQTQYVSTTLHCVSSLIHWVCLYARVSAQGLYFHFVNFYGFLFSAEWVSVPPRLMPDTRLTMLSMAQVCSWTEVKFRKNSQTIRRRVLIEWNWAGRRQFREEQRYFVWNVGIYCPGTLWEWSASGGSHRGDNYNEFALAHFPEWRVLIGW